MKKSFIMTLAVLISTIFSCGSTKQVTQDDAVIKPKINSIELPPNVASNKYSKKRRK